MIYIIAISVILKFVLCSENRPMLQLEEGLVQGISRISAKGLKYYAFEGIPYAEPPVESRRFAEAVPVKPWAGVWPAFTPGCKCLQYVPTESESQRIQGHEDCLFISVYTPKLPSEDLLGVVVWLHSGGFTYGSGDVDPKYIMDHNLVFVTLNYRLGILGFLSTEDSVVPGNNGFKDQTLALKWIQKNIVIFGGNPDSVTLIGLSSGAASVHYHYHSPLSKGLFHRGVSVSGSDLSPWTFSENMKQKAESLGVFLGCRVDSSDHLVTCLRNIRPKEIVNQTTQFKLSGEMQFSPFGPVAEKSSNHAFITQHPLHILQNEDIQDLPWITSVTAEEVFLVIHGLISNTTCLQYLDREFSAMAHFLDYYHTVVPQDNIPKVGNEIRRFYFGDNYIHEGNVNLIIKLASDRLVYYPEELSAHLQAARSRSPVYFYYISNKGALCMSHLYHVYHGTSDGDDAAYTFGSSHSNTGPPELEYKMMELLLNLFTNLIHTRAPETPTHIDTDWPPINLDNSNLAYLHIVNTDVLRVECTEELGNRKFRETLPIKESQNEPLKISEEL